MRADAKRNREALLAAAAHVFAAKGPDVSMLEIAEAAGVGVGTLYRHFPQRESLVVAISHEGLKAVCDRAVQLLADHPADEAIELWLRGLARFLDDNRALKQVAIGTPALSRRPADAPVAPLWGESYALLTSTVSQLLDAGVRQNLIGPYADPSDLLRATTALSRVDLTPDETARIISLLVDGLRHRRL